MTDFETAMIQTRNGKSSVSLRLRASVSAMIIISFSEALKCGDLLTEQVGFNTSDGVARTGQTIRPTETTRIAWRTVIARLVKLNRNMDCEMEPDF